MDQVDFWDEFNKVEEKVLKENRLRVQAALNDLKVISMDMRYLYRYSSDEGSGQSHPLSATLADASVVDLNVKWGQKIAPEDPAFPIKSAEVEIESAWTSRKGDEWTIEHSKKPMNLIDAIQNMSLVSEDFMRGHGATSTDSEYDDEGGTRYTESTEGRARVRVMDMKPQPLDENGNIQQPRFASSRRW